MSSKPTLAFAGLGAMGSGMCTHLLSTGGYAITAYDPYPPSLDRIVAKGAQPAATSSDAAKTAQFFIVMVATHHQANSLLFSPGTDGAVTALPQNATIILCSTVPPSYIHALRARLDALSPSRADVVLIDAPVSGGAARAANGTLSIFAAAAKAEHLEAVKPILECLSDEGKLYTVEGGLGAGSKAKLIHQVFAGVHIAMASEAMGLVARAGLDVRGTFGGLMGEWDGNGNGKVGRGWSWMFENRVPHMLDPGLGRYSAMGIIAKDVGIITSTAREERWPLPVLSTCEQLYQLALASGLEREDDCELVRLYLPGQEYLVARRAEGGGGKGVDTVTVTVEDVRNLMVGVHLAVVSEAMAFCERLGVDVEMMYDIVVNAAGASEVFKKEFQSMREARWSLKGVEDVESIRENLMTSVAKAHELRYPLFLSSAALQEFHRQLR